MSSMAVTSPPTGFARYTTLSQRILYCEEIREQDRAQLDAIFRIQFGVDRHNMQRRGNSSINRHKKKAKQTKKGNGCQQQNTGKPKQQLVSALLKEATDASGNAGTGESPSTQSSAATGQ
jgi:hypothetical protein